MSAVAESNPTHYGALLTSLFARTAATNRELKNAN
jgi:hypothetical protein